MKIKQLFTIRLTLLQIVLATFSILGDSASTASHKHFVTEMNALLYPDQKDSVKAREFSDRMNNIIESNQNVDVIKLIREHNWKKNGKIGNQYSYEWKIRGKRHLSQKDEIFIEPITDQIDTVFFRHPADKVWDFFLCRISVPGTYESRVNPCCGDFIFKSTVKIPTKEAEVIFKMLNSNGKLHLCRIGDKGAILYDSVKLKTPCMFNWSAMYTMVSIEEIDTIESHEKCRHIEDHDGIDPYDYSPGIVIDPFVVTDCCVPRQLMCFEKNGKEAKNGTYNYCSKKRVVGFRFNWLDDKPLIVEFDAKWKKVYLK